MIKGDTFNEVRDKLSDYRLNNNRPIGNPGQDILKYYAVNFPWMVKEDDIEIPEEPENYSKWRSWIQKTWVRPPKKMLTIKEASIRSDICKSCPHNKPIQTGNKPSEFEQLTKKSFLLRRGVKISSDLGYCDLHHFDLGVALFIETPKDHSEKKKDTPGHPSCWV